MTNPAVTQPRTAARLAGLPTPCLVLDRGILARNLAGMAAALARHGVPLRPHMKTAKSMDVARMALAGQPGGITVSTLAEAEYFAGHGINDILYAVGVTPAKLDRVAALRRAGANVLVITDDPATATAIAAHPAGLGALVEVDSGEHRGGGAPDSPRLLQVATRLGPALRGVITHGGHSYAGRSDAEMELVAEQERAAAVGAAERLRAAGHSVGVVSVGSSPTALHARHLQGVTEVRAGVYMFGDLFQASIGTHGPDDIALTVLAAVIGLRPAEHRLLADAGGLALSKDRSTQPTTDLGFGLVLDAHGCPTLGRSVVAQAYQEHGVVALDPALPFPDLRVGDLLRIAPNHACMTAAAHDRYWVVDGSDAVVAEWERANGW